MQSENLKVKSIGLGPCNQGGSDATFMSDAPALVYMLEQREDLKDKSERQRSDGVGPLSLCHTVSCNDNEVLTRGVDVWNGVSEFRAEDSEYRGSQPDANGKKKRGIITQRSQKSRVRQLKHFMKLPTLPEMFSTLTFSDDVVGRMSQAEQIVFANRCKRVLATSLSRCLNNDQWEFTWSQEWKRRKSGAHAGKLVLHLHVLWQVVGMSAAEYHHAALNISWQWVRITGTYEPEKAMKVLMRPKSHQYLGRSAKASVRYCTKYTVKEGSDPGEPGESIGRCWGSWGPMEEAEPETISISEPELTSIKRGLRRKFRKARGGFLMSLKIRQAGTMAFLMGSEMIRWVETMRVQNKGAGLPF